MSRPYTSTRSRNPWFRLPILRLWPCNNGRRSLGRSESTEHIIYENQNADQSWRRRSIKHLEHLELIPGIKICAYVAASSLFLNLILAIVAFSIGYSRPGQDGFYLVTLYEGSCSVTKGWSTWLHLLINILGTFILSSGNYCAQFLGAPTREDVDRSHMMGSWLDIGEPSIRNIWALGKRQRILWFALLITTVPIHAMYNSVILMSKSSNAYSIFIAPAHFDGNRPLTLSSNSSSCFQTQMTESLTTFNSDLRKTDFNVLTKEQCATTFSTNYLSGHGRLVILSSNLTWEDTDTIVSAGIGNSVENYGALTTPAPYGWMCPDEYYGCTKTYVQDHLVNWKVAGTQWSKTTWGLTVPSKNGAWADYAKNSLRKCPLDDANDALCIDLGTLFNFIWSGTPVTMDDIKAYTDNPDNWENSTWAREVRYYPSQTYCEKAGEQPDILDKKYMVDGCLSTQVEEHCRLLFSPLFSLIVIICTMVKTACILHVAFYDRVPRLLTIGDAIASFLTKPDTFTDGRCLASKADWKGKVGPWNGLSQHTLPRKLKIQTRRWWKGPSIFQWAVTLLSCFGCILCAGLLLNRGLGDSKLVDYHGTSLSNLWNLGLGDLNASTIIFQINSTLLGNVLVANIPQVIISISYYYYNAVLTAMLMASEYDGYAVAGTCAKANLEKRRFAPKKGLRVSGKLHGTQRSTYFLSLPYRYSLPLMGTYAVLHWLVSQSIFYVKVTMYDTSENRVPSADVDACGWSPMALILSIAIGSLMILALVALGLRKFRSCIPLFGSCSAAISAACHPQGDSDAAAKAIIWGEIVPLGSHVETKLAKGVIIEVSSVNSDNNRGGFGHCSFTSQDVVQPSPGRIYL
ncbi:hypothetical protein BDV59DRAFT_179659 [Aspergillus ambiguus]|uniref:uncharacterized protein n=1 Tax=Aspergillus ambiguus TaxID=176160 RepID=UPI003CCE3DB1